MADIYRYDLQPLAENEDLRRKSKQDVRQALAKIANHFPLPLDEIRPVLDSVLEYLNLGCIEDKQVSTPLYSPWVKTPIERMVDVEQGDTGKWRTLLLDRPGGQHFFLLESMQVVFFFFPLSPKSLMTFSIEFGDRPPRES